MTAPLALTLLRGTVGATERLAPSLTAPILHRLFFTPPRHAPSASERRFLARGRFERMPFGADSLATWTWGEGPRVVLLHGWGSRTGQMRSLAQHLVHSGFSVTGLDAPAHGRSPGRRSSLIRFSEALDAVVGRLGPVHGVVAHSLGGAAAALSLSRGLPADHAVLIGTPAFPKRFFLQLMQQLGVPEIRWRALCEDMERRVGQPWSAVEGPRLLPRTGTPVLVIHDRKDLEVPFAQAEALATAPGASLHATEGLGHRRILSSPGVHAQVAAFLGDGAPCGDALLEAELFDPSLR